MNDSEYAEGVRKSMSEPFKPYNRVTQEARQAARYERRITILSWIVGLIGGPLLTVLVAYNVWRHFHAH